MCGIVGAVAERDIVPILLEGLRRLEYRGYDSAGLALLNPEAGLQRRRVVGKVAGLADNLSAAPLRARVGIAHTRWATHGKPSEANAHPHISANRIAVVHNGIIENYQSLHDAQVQRGYRFESETDTEVIAHQIHYYLNQGRELLAAVRAALDDLQGAYALGVICTDQPERLIAARRGSPLVIGVGIGEHFIASDVTALLPVTQKVIFLEDGDIADLSREQCRLYDADGQSVERKPHTSELQADAVERGEFRHYMLKEIFEQPKAVADTLEGRISGSGRVLEESLGPRAKELLDQVEAVQIIACGTSYHAGLVARYWLEQWAKVPCNVEVASEFRYRDPLARPNTLLIAISQSGETADTLAAIEEARRLGFGPVLGICNVPESALARCADLLLMTRAGPEIGVASTKAFTTQLSALMLLTVALGRRHGLDATREADIVNALHSLPNELNNALRLHAPIRELAESFADKQHALFLGRGMHYPIAMEGALKLKEISYIHAEAYPAGELKHGPLALVDADMPVIAVAPNDALQEKLKSNLQEVQARGGELFIFADHRALMQSSDYVHLLELGEIDPLISPIVYSLPLQLLAYEVAVLKGTDVDQPRNLAKSVTVE